MDRFKVLPGRDRKRRKCFGFCSSLPKLGIKRRMKARAPPPPNQPPASCKANNERKLSTDVGMLPDQGGINMKENMINRTVDFTVVFPDGDEQKNTVHGSKAVMDLLVDLCSQYHLNPAHHTLELQSWGTQQPLQYKPNTLIGALDVQKILLKEKTPEGKTKRPPPRIPEKTVRLVVNYLKTQKAVVRVNPEVPLESIIPAICEKCEVNQEHLILLRDTITGEELELTKSLNELGIKELYAWDRKRVFPSKAQSEPSLNCRETRNSISCDPVEKEKKRFLGFFRTNKRSSKAEDSLVRMDVDYAGEEPLKSTTASQQSLDRITTAPNSTSVNSCSMTLGPSLSLGNISGMTANSEIKKRRAPLPPTVMPQSGETNGQEKTQSQQMSLSSSQNEFQKKKRRAPPPPAPPTPTMPNKIDEMEDKRQSTVGDGRHVPQKPPRGNTRGPPQLVIPPPPPYPPPDSDMDPPVLYNGTDGTDTTKLVPKYNLQSSHTIQALDNLILELSEAEETTSVSSCFASEDTTEDSGVISSPSDIVSLDSQNDSVRSRDKSVNAQENLSGIESTVVAESCSLKNASFNSDESGNFHQSPEEDEAMEVRFKNSETLIAARLEQTLAAFDKELAAMEGTHEDSESEPIPSEMDGPLPQNVEAAEDIPPVVPVTIIDEVPEADIAMHYTRGGGDVLLSQTQANEDVPVNPISPGKPSNENNNAGSFSKGDVNSDSRYLSKGLLQQPSPDPGFRHRNEEEQKYEFQASSWEKRKKEEATLEVVSKNVTNFKLMDKVNGAKEKAKSLSEQDAKEGIPSKTKTELEFRPGSARSTNDKEAAPPPSPWCSRVHSVVASYEPKIGLTTFKVVPPKPEVKRFDADVSLSTGAIKIDELGNLVTPNPGGIKKVAVNTPLSETGGTLVGRAKAYWRSNSMEKPLEESPEGSSNKSPVIHVSKPFSKASETKHDCLTGLKVATVPQVGSKAVGNNLGPEKTKPPFPVTQYPMKAPTAPVGNKDKVELPFQKPQRRTSSHYVASAIAKSLDPPQLRTSREKRDKEEENSDQRGAKAEMESLPKRCIIVAKSCPVEPQPARTNEGYSRIFSCDKNAANKLPSGAQSKMKSHTANITSPNQISPSSCYGRSFSAPFSTLSSQGGITEEETSRSSAQNVIVKETSSIVHQNGEPAGQTSSLSSFRPCNAPSSPIACNSLVKSGSGHTIHSGSLKCNGTPLVNHVASRKEENLGGASAGNELEANIRDDNIYSVFGPKKRFKPVIQKPLPRDTSLHGALMEAIQTAGGREKLRKIPVNAVNGTQRKGSVSEPENERSALLAAIRGHSGACKLRKTSSSASEELQSFRNAELGLQIRETSPIERLCNPPLPSLPPPPPPPPAHLSTRTPRPLANSITENPGDARQALMEAIRLGTGAARLRKVPLLV
ncbi:PREDICTED: protein cordon-bleu [Gekko japonicus]|uniref:Protein cordon-bleu n=1 Tax=Gekko japonicus TaxID=146911 RepID=A0ABM1JHP8_GEKJA|nr:PREDICTED: protein cordon-bleu [Gekko japonicus]